MSSLDAYISDLNATLLVDNDDMMTLPDTNEFIWDGPDSVSEIDEDNWEDEDEETNEETNETNEANEDEESEITLSESQMARVKAGEVVDVDDY